VLDEVVPQALALIKSRKSEVGGPKLKDSRHWTSDLGLPTSDFRLFVIHQTRPENVEKLRREYAKIGVKNNVMSFIKDMAGELAAASLVISRAGAGTVAEMQTVGVPAILVPLGINPDQLANARQFAAKGGGIVIEQQDFTPESLARTLEKLAGNPGRLAKMAKLAFVPNNAVQNIINVISG
jgi:UDP-N-acetylglucosamine:LPS N-acetylglucosamine transferase